MSLCLAGAGAAEHNVPGAAPDGDDVDGARVLQRTAALPAADIRPAAGPRRRAAGRRRLAGDPRPRLGPALPISRILLRL